MGCETMQRIEDFERESKRNIKELINSVKVQLFISTIKIIYSNLNIFLTNCTIFEY